MKKQIASASCERVFGAAPHNSARDSSEKFCLKIKFGKRRNTLCTRKGGMPQPLPAEAGNGCAVFSAFGTEKRAEKIHPSTAPMASQVLSGRQLTKKLIPLPDNVPRFPE